jgi:Putative restriction endonuclease
MQMFARYGVPEYWIVDPRARRIEVYRLVYRLEASASILAAAASDGCARFADDRKPDVSGRQPLPR